MSSAHARCTITVCAFSFALTVARMVTCERLPQSWRLHHQQK
jgi:hypothetical protein